VDAAGLERAVPATEADDAADQHAERDGGEEPEGEDGDDGQHGIFLAYLSDRCP
jgi:hypothetical protein